MAAGEFKGRTLETLVGAAVIFVASFFLWYGLSQAEATDARGGYKVSAEFSNASGISRGSEVRMSGVRIGKVSAQSLDPKTYNARIEIEIDSDIRLSEDTAARILSDGLLGNSYVSLTPGGADAFIPEGGEILYTQDSVNLIDLLGRFIFSGSEN